MKNNINYSMRNDLNVFECSPETLFVEIDKDIFSTEKNMIVIEYQIKTYIYLMTN